MSGIVDDRSTGNAFQMGEEFFRASFFCGVGLGVDSGGTGGAQAMNGDDDGDGVRVQTRGPFVLRYTGRGRGSC